MVGRLTFNHHVPCTWARGRARRWRTTPREMPLVQPREKHAHRLKPAPAQADRERKARVLGATSRACDTTQDTMYAKDKSFLTDTNSPTGGAAAPGQGATGPGGAGPGGAAGGPGGGAYTGPKFDSTKQRPGAGGPMGGGPTKEEPVVVPPFPDFPDDEL